MEDFYEELPAESTGEDLYEDLPCNQDISDSYYQQDSSAPPLPSPRNYPAPPSTDSPAPLLPSPRRVPQQPKAAPQMIHRHAPAPPTRSPNPSAVTATSQTLPANVRKKKEPVHKKEPVVVPKKTSGGGGGGIDMGEILKKAKQRRENAFENLEKHQNKDEDDSRHMAPWKNALKKTPTSPSHTAAATEESDSVPEFVKKAHRRSQVLTDSLESSGDSSTTRTPPLTTPPPSSTPPLVRKKPQQPAAPPPVHQDEKPAWLKQREKQLQSVSAENDAEPKPPSAPPSSSQPPPPAVVPPKPKERGPPPPTAEKKPHHHPPSMAPKPPVVAPSPKPRAPAPIPPGPKPLISNGHPEIVSRGSEGRGEKRSPPMPLVRERTRTLERIKPELLPPKPSPKPPVRSPHTGVSETPPLPPSVAPPPSKLPPKPPASQPPPPMKPPPPPAAKPPPPPPTTTSKPPPPVPSHSPPTPRGEQPSPEVPPPSRKSPLPAPAPSPKIAPSPPQQPKAPPRRSSLTSQVSQGESTPPTGTLLKFRRLPLPAVDPSRPHMVPSRGSKPKSPGAIDDDDVGGEQIYDDTMAMGDEGKDEQMEDVYDDVGIDLPPPKAPSTPSSSTVTSPRTSISSGPPLIPSLPPAPSYRPPPPPIAEMSDRMEEEEDQHPPNGTIPSVEEDMGEETYEQFEPVDFNGAPSLPPSLPPSRPPSNYPSTSSLTPPPPTHSPSPSPTLSKKLSKEDLKKFKEEEKERKRLEKERKKREEIKTKNRQKGIKSFKQFNLSMEVQSLFAVEVLLEHPKTKDHLGVSEGEIVFVLLLSHPKLPDTKYLVEKEDGTIGFVDKRITQRTAYQSAQSVLLQSTSSQDLLANTASTRGTIPHSTSASSNIEIVEEIEEDIYESLAGDQQLQDQPLPPPVGVTGGKLIPPALPQRHFPAPSVPPPPPPEDMMDGPEETYEYLPDEVS